MSDGKGFIVLVHGDLDGRACEIVARRLWPHARIEEHNYNERLDNRMEELLGEKNDSWEGLVMADLHPRDQFFPRLEEEVKKGRYVRIYDHHKTSQPWSEKYAWVHNDNKLCGAQLLAAYHARHPGEGQSVGNVDTFLETVAAYDLWKLDDPLRPLAEELNHLCMALSRMVFVQLFLDGDYDHVVWDRENKVLDHISVPASLVVASKISKEKRYFENCYTRVQTRKDADNNVFLEVYMSQGMSGFAEYVRAAGFPAGAKYLQMTNVETGSVSLRTLDPEFDVSILAKARGGGGHRAAAGYPALFARGQSK